MNIILAIILNANLMIQMTFRG